MGLWVRGALVALLATAACAVAAASASAGTIDLVGDTVVFTAAPGEINDVGVGEGASYAATLTVEDKAVPLTVNTPVCALVNANRAVCSELPSGAARPVTVYAGDGNDKLGGSAYGQPNFHRKILLDAGTGNDAVGLGTQSNIDAEVLGGEGNDTIQLNSNGTSPASTLRGGARR